MGNMIKKGKDVSAWLGSVTQDAAVRRVLLLHGNVQDIFYDPQERQYVLLSELLSRTFLRDSALGFTMVAQWDQADGLRFADPRMLQRLRDAMAGRKTQPPANQDQPYDTGQADDRNGQIPAATGLYTNPTELFPVIRTIMDHPTERPVFILDWSHLLYTQPTHPDREERNWILSLSKAIRGTSIVPMNTDHLKGAKGVVIFLAAGLGALPPVLYQGDPRVRLIAIPRPNRPERQGFFLRHGDDLRCEQPKGDGRPLAVGAGGVGRQERADVLADLTDQFQMIDMQQVLRLSLRTDAPLTPERLVNLYKYGEKTSPWEELGEEKLEQVDDVLKKRVIGQDAAVAHVGTMIIRAYMGLAGLQHSGRRSKPKGTLFFVGPTGVGKTELAKGIAEFLFGDESACIRFDMSEYNHEHSDQRLVGAPPGYVGFEDGGQLTNAVRERPFSVLLFDEIEKAHPRVLDKFLQILEDGRLTDGRGETTYFSECVIIFTSNIGAAEMPKGDDFEALRMHFESAVEAHFVQKLNRPELLNRLGQNVVVFNKITEAGFRRSIFRKKVQPLVAYLRERFGVDFAVTDALENQMLERTRSDQGGRGLINALESGLVNDLARFLFGRRHQLRLGRKLVAGGDNGHLSLDLQEGQP